MQMKHNKAAKEKEWLVKSQTTVQEDSLTKTEQTEQIFNQCNLCGKGRRCVNQINDSTDIQFQWFMPE